MAKKRKKEKQEKDSYEYKPPDFDEEEYLRKEVRDTKTLLVTIGYAVVIGIASYGVMFTEVALAILLGFIAVVFLRHIYPLIGVDTSALEKKQWAGNILMYLFTWLAVWILLTNPPFSDIAGPTFKNEKLYYEDINGTMIVWDDTASLNGSTNMSYEITIVDNVDVDVDSVRIKIMYGDDELTDAGGSYMTRQGTRYSYEFIILGSGKHEFTVTAKDVNGNEEDYVRSHDI